MTALEPVTISAVLLWAGLLLVVGLLFGAGDPVEALRAAWRRHRRWRRKRASRRRRLQPPSPPAHVTPIEHARRIDARRAREDATAWQASPTQPTRSLK